MNEVDCKNVLAKNIVFYRKSLNLKQSDLAAKLNYSDKAISKWERGEAVPDVLVLTQLAKLFGITIDKLCSEHKPGIPQETEVAPKNKRTFTFLKNRLLISLMSVGLVWFVATMIVVFGNMFLPGNNYWLAFIYAIPCTIILLIIFNSIWGKRLYGFVLVSVLIWAIALCFYLSIPLERSNLIFWLAFPAQFIIILASFITTKNKAKNK